MENTLRRIYQIILIAVFMAFFSLNLNAASTVNQVVITKIEAHIDGSTKRRFLLQEIGLYEGRKFADFDFLQDYMDESIQDLINMRVFESVEYHMIETYSSEELIEYTIILRVRDTWNIYPIVYPKYDSNRGFSLGFEFNYFNTFGTLMDFLFYSSINIKNNIEKEMWEIPFWNITPTLSGINFWGQEFSISLNQSFSTETKYNDGKLQQEFTVHTSSASIGTKLFLTRDFYYTISPKVSFNYGIQELEMDSNGQQLPQYGTEIDYEFSNLSLSQELGYDCLDWIGNFREGFTVFASNELVASYDLKNNIALKSTLLIGGNIFWKINNYFNFSSQINGIYSSNFEMTGLGSFLRGVRDDYMYGNLGAFMSVDLNISLLDIDGVGEIQMRPFFEIGIIGHKEVNFNFKNDFAYTTGADFVFYLDKLNSIQTRTTIGFDLSNPDWTDRYEIEITGALSY